MEYIQHHNALNWRQAVQHLGQVVDPQDGDAVYVMGEICTNCLHEVDAHDPLTKKCLFGAAKLSGNYADRDCAFVYLKGEWTLFSTPTTQPG